MREEQQQKQQRKCGLLPLLLLLLSIPSVVVSQGCTATSCPQGYACDSNTGICRQFRIAGTNDNNGGGGGGAGLCANVNCNLPLQCDSNTGRCVMFRIAGNDGGYIRYDPCIAVTCPYGYQCDSNNGQCVRFRESGSQGSGYNSVGENMSRCFNVFCPYGLQCDTNTGLCVRFRTGAEGMIDPRVTQPLCNGVPCPPNSMCDPTTSRCFPNIAFSRDFPRDYSSYPATSRCLTPCPSGTTCDENTGHCQRWIRSAPFYLPCSDVVCSAGYECHPGSGQCEPIRVPYRRAVRESLDTSLCKNRVCAEPNAVCDERTGRCRLLATAPGHYCQFTSCPAGKACDPVTGQCKHFQPADAPCEKCYGVNCGQGASCDPVTGACLGSNKVRKSSSCLGGACPLGTSCDENTGRCTQFRPPADNVVGGGENLNVGNRISFSLCYGVLCPAGSICDTNTGLCSQFRYLANYGYKSVLKSLCEGVECPQGTSCDENTGRCTQFRPPADIIAGSGGSESLCTTVQCPAGSSCDGNTGLCVRFQTGLSNTYSTNYKGCGDLTCPVGTTCDENTGLCVQFRPSVNDAVVGGTGSGGSSAPIFVNPCSGVLCPMGTSCDENSGKCVQFRPPAQRRASGFLVEEQEDSEEATVSEPPLPPGLPILSKCSTTTCPPGYFCSGGSGVCLRNETFPTFNVDRCANVRCPLNSVCDPNSGQCRAFRPPTYTGNPCDVIKCPPNTECDPITGLCRLTANPDNKCEGVICQQGFKCDFNTGECKEFRKPVDEEDAVEEATLHPHASAVIPSAEENLCENIACPLGHICDSNTGICERVSFLITAEVCASTVCPFGTVCELTSGKCIKKPNLAGFRIRKTFPNRNEDLDERPDLCENVKCRNGATCEKSSGICRAPTPDKCFGIRCATGQECVDGACSSPKCAGVLCPVGYSCQPSTGECEALSCPQHSHFVGCGSPCPYTCNRKTRCSSECIPTCECDDGYMQASRTNTTCVAAADCPKEDRQLRPAALLEKPPITSCTHLRCSDSMVCTSGYCNPVNCPPIRKPPLKLRCEYALQRDQRNCIYIGLNCEPGYA